MERMRRRSPRIQGGSPDDNRGARGRAGPPSAARAGRTSGSARRSAARSDRRAIRSACSSARFDLETLVVNVGLLQLVDDAMELVQLLEDLPVDLPRARRHRPRRLRGERRRRVGEELELARAGVHFLEQVRKVVPELVALDPPRSACRPGVRRCCGIYGRPRAAATAPGIPCSRGPVARSPRRRPVASFWRVRGLPILPE